MSDLRRPICPISLCCAVALTACTASGPPAGDEGDGQQGQDELPSLFPEALHTGFDGVATFRVPAIVRHATGPVTWSTSDPTVATLESDGDRVMLISLDTGTTTLVAEMNGQQLTAEVYVALYDASLAPLGDGIYADRCASCHVASDGPDHTPSEIGQYADSELATMIYAGIDPRGTEWPEHQWALEGDDMRAMLRHIRQLEPRGLPSPAE